MSGGLETTGKPQPQLPDCAADRVADRVGVVRAGDGDGHVHRRGIGDGPRAVLQREVEHRAPWTREDHIGKSDGAVVAKHDEHLVLCHVRVRRRRDGGRDADARPLGKGMTERIRNLERKRLRSGIRDIKCPRCEAVDSPGSGPEDQDAVLHRCTVLSERPRRKIMVSVAESRSRGGSEGGPGCR